MDGSMSKLLIFKPRCGHLGGDIDLIQILHAGRERNASPCQRQGVSLGAPGVSAEGSSLK